MNIVEIHKTIKKGWDEYNAYFWIGSFSTLIGGFFGFAGVAAILFSFGFFWFMGKFHTKLESTQKDE